MERTVRKILWLLAAAIVSGLVGWVASILTGIDHRTAAIEVQVLNQREWSTELETDIEEMGTAVNTRIDQLYNVALGRLLDTIYERDANGWRPEQPGQPAETGPDTGSD